MTLKFEHLPKFLSHLGKKELNLYILLNLDFSNRFFLNDLKTYVFWNITYRFYCRRNNKIYVFK